MSDFSNNQCVELCNIEGILAFNIKNASIYSCTVQGTDQVYRTDVIEIVWKTYEFIYLHKKYIVVKFEYSCVILRDKFRHNY